MAQSNMGDVTIHKNMLLRKVCVEENCRLRQKYSICLLEEVVVLGYFADKAQVCILYGRTKKNIVRVIQI